MSWTVLIPLNASGRRKTRLAPALDLAAREALAHAMYEHVLACAQRFGRVCTVTPNQLGNLNAELAHARDPSSSVMVLNADLPLLCVDDLRMLADAAEHTGSAVAADRHGLGTNAVALLPHAPFAFAFGPGSLAAHLRWTSNVVLRSGLACDLDTPADLEYLRTRLPAPVRGMLPWEHAHAAE